MQRFKFGLDADGEELEELESSKASGFDQFVANKQKFNVGYDYDDTDYQPYLDPNSFTDEQKKHFAKLASEIERGESSHDISNRHVKEERGQLALLDNDNEEDLYSAVEMPASAAQQDKSAPKASPDDI